MRSTTVILFVLLLCPASWGQSVGDTVRVDEGQVREDSSVFANESFTLPRGAKVRIEEVGGRYFRLSSGDREGWMHKMHILEGVDLKRYREEQRQAREKHKHLQRLRERGMAILLEGQRFSVNSANGITVTLRLRNISEERTVKYARIRWKLHNSVGDPVSGEHGTPPEVTTKFVGPLEPGETATVQFDNLWYNAVGACAEIRRIDVERIDGSSFTYINDLREITEYAQSVRLKGGCSYEAQKARDVK